MKQAHSCGTDPLIRGRSSPPHRFLPRATAYLIACLVVAALAMSAARAVAPAKKAPLPLKTSATVRRWICLLYTSDAADE